MQEKIWDDLFTRELRVEPTEHAVFLTESPSNPDKHREKMTEIMFETFKIPKFYLSINAVCASYSTGRTTGIVLDSGWKITHSVPIHEGNCIKQAVGRLDFGGNDLMMYWYRLLSEKGCSFTGSVEVYYLVIVNL